MTRIAISFGLILLGASCHSGVEQAAEAKSAAQASQAAMEQHAAAVASELAQKAVQDDKKQRDQIALDATAAREKLRESVSTGPSSYFEVGKLQMSNHGPFRRLSSLSLTNNSKFLVTDLHGTVDFHGEIDRPGSNSDVIASVPVDLTGSIAPGASMVFSEQQHTLSGAAIQLTAPPRDIDFTVTGVSSVR